MVFLDFGKHGFERFDRIRRLAVDGEDDVAGGETAKSGPTRGCGRGDEHALEIVR